MIDRERIGRQSSPSGAIIDSQSVTTTEAGAPRGYHASKMINGHKRLALPGEIKSLNVSNATALALYVATEQRT